MTTTNHDDTSAAAVLDASRRLSAIMILVDETAEQGRRYRPTQCTLIDGAITCQLLPKETGPAFTYPPGEPFDRILVELMDSIPPRATE